MEISGYVAYANSSETGPLNVRAFSPTTGAVIGSVSMTLTTHINATYNSVAVNPTDGDIIVSTGNPVFRVSAGATPAIAGEISLPASCGPAVAGPSAILYFQCGSSTLATVSESSYLVSTVVEQATFSETQGPAQALYGPLIFQGPAGTLYSWGGQIPATSGGEGFPAMFQFSTAGSLTGYYSPNGQHDQAVQGVVATDGTAWISVENLYQGAYVLHVNP